MTLRSRCVPLALVCACLAAACDGGAACVPGASSACTCTTGEPGAQLCEDDGTYGECMCAATDGGADTDAGSPADAGTLTDAATGDAGGDSSVDTDAGPIEGIVEVSASWFRTCAVHSDGRTLCWGGELGESDRDCPARPIPTTVPTLTDVRELALSYSHSCARRGAGQVVCWGYGSQGALGDGRSMSSDAPVTARGIADAIQIAIGGHSCALRSDGSVWCWGPNSAGQIGSGGVGDPVEVPSRVMGISDAVQIAAASGYTCARLGGGTIRCWGSNSVGQLGNGATGDGTGIPSDVIGIEDAVDVSAGLVHVCAVRADGTVWCWGMGEGGRLGNASTSDSSVPVRVMGIDDAVDVGAFGAHSCALRRGGRLACWGGGGNGQLGNGELTGYTIPVETAPIEGTVLQITGGHYHTCARTSNGELFCWGGTCGASGSATDELLPRLVTIP